MLDLEKIVKECKKQKADSQKLLYEHYFGEMMMICNRYANTNEDAEEMLNNGFLKIFVNIDKFDNKGSFEGWMKRTMVNSCLDFFKTKTFKDKQRIIAPNSDIIYNPEKEGKLYDAGSYDVLEIEDTLTKEDLLASLEGLTPLAKAIFNLVVFEDYTHKEIAEELDISERTSQWHYSNARKIVVEQLTQAQIKNKKVSG